MGSKLYSSGLVWTMQMYAIIHISNILNSALFMGVPISVIYIKKY